MEIKDTFKPMDKKSESYKIARGNITLTNLENDNQNGILNFNL